MKYFILLLIAFIFILSQCEVNTAKLDLLYDGLGSITSIKFTSFPYDKYTDECYPRMVVLLQNGIIKVETNDGTLKTLLDISNIITMKGIRGDPRVFSELGLLGITFHNNFTNNGRMFLYYTINRMDGKTNLPVECEEMKTFPLIFNPNEYNVLGVLAEYYVRDLHTIPKFVRNLLMIRQPYRNHNGLNNLFTFPNGNLGLGLGDGGCKYDPFRNGQNEDSLLGSILSIDLSNLARTTSCDKPVSFLSELHIICSKMAGSVAIYAIGIRNPNSFFTDIFNGISNIYFYDVGQHRAEEINLLIPIGNYQWLPREGYECTCLVTDTFPDPKCFPYSQTLKECLELRAFNNVPPLTTMSHEFGDLSAAIIGGPLVRNTIGLEVLQCKLLFASWSKINHNLPFPGTFTGESMLKYSEVNILRYNRDEIYEQGQINLPKKYKFLTSIGYFEVSPYYCSNSNRVILGFSGQIAPLNSDGTVNRNGKILELVYI